MPNPIVRGARMAAGPAILAGFFLPWIDGHGVLAGERYSGYDLVRLAGYLQHAHLSGVEQVGLTLARVALVGMVAAAIWLTAMAPHWHEARLSRASGWYLAVAAAFVAGGVLWWDGPSAAPGMLLTVGGGAAWLATQPGWRRARVSMIADRESEEARSPA